MSATPLVYHNHHACSLLWRASSAEAYTCAAKHFMGRPPACPLCGWRPLPNARRQPKMYTCWGLGRLLRPTTSMHGPAARIGIAHIVVVPCTSVIPQPQTLNHAVISLRAAATDAISGAHIECRWIEINHHYCRVVAKLVSPACVVDAPCMREQIVSSLLNRLCGTRDCRRLVVGDHLSTCI